MGFEAVEILKNCAKLENLGSERGEDIPPCPPGYAPRLMLILLGYIDLKSRLTAVEINIVTAMFNFPILNNELSEHRTRNILRSRWFNLNSCTAGLSEPRTLENISETLNPLTFLLLLPEILSSNSAIVKLYK